MKNILLNKLLLSVVLVIFTSTSWGSEFSGSVYNFSPKIKNNSDKYVDFAIVLEALQRKDLINYNIDKLINWKTKQVKVKFLNAFMPANLALPNQKERFSIFSFNLNSPEYNVNVLSDQYFSLMAIHGQFKVSTVIKKLQKGAPIVSLFNDFRFKSAGRINLNVDSTPTEQNIPIGLLDVEPTITVKAPKLKEGKSVIVFAMNEENSWYYPTDVKYLGSKEKTSLAYNSTKLQGSNSILGVLGDQIKTTKFYKHRSLKNVGGEKLRRDDSVFEVNFKNISTTLTNPNLSQPIQFLETIKTPVLVNNQLLATPPKTLAGVSPLATIVELVKSERVLSGRIIHDFKTVISKQIVPGWANAINVKPSRQIQKENGFEYRYEITFVGSERNPSTNGAPDLNQFSHTSKNFVVVD